MVFVPSFESNLNLNHKHLEKYKNKIYAIMTCDQI